VKMADLPRVTQYTRQHGRFQDALSRPVLSSPLPVAGVHSLPPLDTHTQGIIDADKEAGWNDPPVLTPLFVENAGGS